jgi:predicted nucleic acid-binding protein
MTKIAITLPSLSWRFAMETNKTKIPKLFIETTVFNFYCEGKQGKKQQDAIKLFEMIAAGKYEACTSKAVIDELERTPEEKLAEMSKLVYTLPKPVLFDTKEAQRLAGIYVAKGIIPQKYATDALHIATATVEEFDFVVSYNFGHIVKLKTIIGVGFVNLREGYKQIGLTTPGEVIDYD